MLETRNYRLFLFVSLILSAVIHVLVLRSSRLDMGLEDKEYRRSIAEMRGIFSGPAGKRLPRAAGRTVVIKLAEGAEQSREAPSATVPKRKKATGGKPEEGNRPTVEVNVGGGVEAPLPFDLDSLDLLLTFPWMAPPREGEPLPRRLVGLERALARLRAQELEKREAEGDLAFDTKHGKFGISSRGILLGPIVIPLPLAPYESEEARAEQRSFREIQEQNIQSSLKDDDLEAQRERVIEWKKRKGEEP